MRRPPPIGPRILRAFATIRDLMSESRFAPLLRTDLAELHSYEPRPGTFAVRLDANESPPLLSPEAAAELARAMVPESYNRYPDARTTALREAIAEHAGASPDEILVGTGSDEVIALLLTALDRPQGKNPAPTLLVPTPTFVMYRQSARARGFKVVEVPLDATWDLEVSSMRTAIEIMRPNVIFIATPNNPTSRLVSLDRLEAVITAAPDALVIVDEAYVDFASRTQIDLRKKHPNVAVLRTLSKIGFAALRVGWLIAPAELVRELDKVRQPYNVPVPSQRGATFVLRELRDEMARMRAEVIAERARLAEGLEKLGFAVTPSDANFLWTEAPRPANELVEALAARGVLVKGYGASGGRLLRRMRITVGLPAENDRLLYEIAQCT
ncbi:Histidinol-phosphate aminotransferase [Minicystis rosea]|nr:Histidinol-phosphate aminotransferase [Minicystis rosea]